MKIFVTGGAGYIGSHTCLSLLEQGFEVTVYDNLINSNLEALRRIKTITGKQCKFVQGDLLDTGALDSALSAAEFQAVIHFAGLKSVGESVERPLAYYQNNVSGTLNLLNAMEKHQLFNVVFSSSATVYGEPEVLPLPEAAGRSATNPYGQTKLMVEHVLEDLAASDPRWKIANLRYFNPVGAHSSGMIGEDPNGIPNNLLPFISQVAVGRREKVSVFGNDYDTVDGTGVRDYIHVVDLAEGHLAALRYLLSTDSGEFIPVNLGTGNGFSVLEMIEAFSKASCKSIPYEFVKRRSGDVAACYADARLAKEKFGWQAKLNLNDMCDDAWRWQINNPNGY